MKNSIKGKGLGCSWIWATTRIERSELPKDGRENSGQAREIGRANSVQTLEAARGVCVFF